MNYTVKDITRFPVEQRWKMDKWCKERSIKAVDDDEWNTTMFDISEEDLIIFKLIFGV